jgi:ssDNA-binding Zn-finger/Zn-ribbon topoisomerase 1
MNGPDSIGIGDGRKMLKLKSCPKCKNGDVTFDRDLYGWYEYCIQCGYTRDLMRLEEFPDAPAYSENENDRKVRSPTKEK